MECGCDRPKWHEYNLQLPVATKQLKMRHCSIFYLDLSLVVCFLEKSKLYLTDIKRTTPAFTTIHNI